MLQSDIKIVRVAIVQGKEVCEEIKRISCQLGLCWISLVATSKANNIGVEINKRGGEM